GPAGGGGGAGGGGVRAGLPPGVRTEPPLLHLLPPARIGPRPAEPRRRHARVPVPGHPDRTAAGRPVERGDRPLLPARRAQRRGYLLSPPPPGPHLPRRSGEPAPPRPAQHRAGQLPPPPLPSAHRTGAPEPRPELPHPPRQAP